MKAPNTKRPKAEKAQYGFGSGFCRVCAKQRYVYLTASGQWLCSFGHVVGGGDERDTAA